MSDVDGVDVTYGRQAYGRQAYGRQAYPRVHKTLRNRRYQQRGGDRVIPALTSDRREFWKKSKELSEDNDLKFLLDNGKNNLTPAEYILVVGQQDKLFEYALIAFYRSTLGEDFGDKKDERTIIDRFKTLNHKSDFNSIINDGLKYIFDIYKLVAFNLPETGTHIYKGYFSVEKDKITIISSNPLLQLFVNPALVKNLFIHDLARICLEHKSNIRLKEDNEEISKLRAKRYNAIIDANALALTTGKSVDGFFLNDINELFRNKVGFDLTTARPGKLFFELFMEYCVVNLPTITDKLPTSSTYRGLINTVLADRFAFLAACVYHKINDTKQVNLQEVEEFIISKITPEKTLTKNESALNNRILKKIPLEHYQFVIHLCAVINKLAMEDTKTPAPPAPPPP